LAYAHALPKAEAAKLKGANTMTEITKLIIVDKNANKERQVLAIN
jgi:hypothetical protein